MARRDDGRECAGSGTGAGVLWAVLARWGRSRAAVTRGSTLDALPRDDGRRVAWLRLRVSIGVEARGGAGSGLTEGALGSGVLVTDL